MLDVTLLGVSSPSFVLLPRLLLLFSRSSSKSISEPSTSTWFMGATALDRFGEGPVLVPPPAVGNGHTIVCAGGNRERGMKVLRWGLTMKEWHFFCKPDNKKMNFFVWGVSSGRT